MLPDKKYCVECFKLANVGYFSDGTYCGMCKANCKTCTDASNCNVCQDGYFKSGSGDCVACATNCKYCTSATVCTECYPEFFVKNNVCNRCKDEGWIVSGLNCVKSCQNDNAECVSCDGANCIKCKPNFFINTLDKTKCISCTEIYHWRDPEGLCYRCDPNCVKCSSKETCLKCKIEYFSNNNGLCETCLTDCEYCNDKRTCNKCKANYYLKNNDSVCSNSCGDGFYVDGGSYNIYLE